MEQIKRSVPGVISFLEASCGLRKIALDSRLFTVEFDAVLVGADPLSIVAIEHKTTASIKSLRQSVRKAQSFVWSLHSNNKFALLSLIFLVPEPISPETLSSIENELSGTARVFVIDETMQGSDFEKHLTLLGNPRLTRSSTHSSPKGTSPQYSKIVMPGHSRQWPRLQVQSKN